MLPAVTTDVVDALGANWPVTVVLAAILWAALRELGPVRRVLGPLR